jgi:hypothetical protein
MRLKLDENLPTILVEDLAPNRGSSWNELGSMESKSSVVDAGSAVSMLTREDA